IGPLRCPSAYGEGRSIGPTTPLVLLTARPSQLSIDNPRAGGRRTTAYRSRTRRHFGVIRSAAPVLGGRSRIDTRPRRPAGGAPAGSATYTNLREQRSVGYPEPADRCWSGLWA